MTWRFMYTHEMTVLFSSTLSILGNPKKRRFKLNWGDSGFMHVSVHGEDMQIIPATCPYGSYSLIQL